MSPILALGILVGSLIAGWVSVGHVSAAVCACRLTRRAWVEVVVEASNVSRLITHLYREHRARIWGVVFIHEGVHCPLFRGLLVHVRRSSSLRPGDCPLALAVSALAFSVSIWPREADLPLCAARGDLLDLLVDFEPIFLAPLVPLVFAHLLSPFDFGQQLLIRLVELVLVVLVEALLWVEEPLVDWLQSLTRWGLESILDCGGLLVVVTVHGEFGRFGAIVGILGLGELHLHRRILVCGHVVHRVWVVQVTSVDHIFNITVVFVGRCPFALLLHNFLEGVSEIGLICLICLDHFVESWVELHNWILFFFGEILNQAHGPQVGPVLRILLQEPGIIVLDIQCGIAHQIRNLLRAWWSGLVGIL